MTFKSGVMETPMESVYIWKQGLKSVCENGEFKLMCLGLFEMKIFFSKVEPLLFFMTNDNQSRYLIAGLYNIAGKVILVTPDHYQFVVWYN